MDEWWSYRPSDLLMFSPAIYWRLFESLNQQAWVPPVLLAGSGLATWVWSLRRPDFPAVRWWTVWLALAWAWVAWAFFWQRWAPIYTAAPTFALLFALQAAGLLLLACVPGLNWAGAGPRRRVGGLLAVWAVAGHPLLVWVFDRPGAQAEWLALAPDPTALATLAWLLLIDGRGHGFVRPLQRLLWVWPLLWCATTSLTLWTLGERQAWVVAAWGLLAGAVAWRFAPERS